jgi:hypothetical protein
MLSRFFFAVAFVVVLAAQPLVGQNPIPASAAQQDAGPAPQESAASARKWRPLPKPTNLKVLSNDIAPRDLMKIMHSYEAALGVECSFCHAANKQTHRLDFASDAKDDKGMARTMMAMTHTINEQFMSQINDPDAMPADKHVTCGTCHRGHSMPAHFTAKPEQHHEPAAGTGQKPQ